MKPSVYLKENLKTLRIAAGETQEQLGRLLKYNRKTVSSYENGRTVPDLETILRIADHYGVTVDDLLRVRLRRP